MLFAWRKILQAPMHVVKEGLSKTRDFNAKSFLKSSLSRRALFAVSFFFLKPQRRGRVGKARQALEQQRFDPHFKLRMQK